MFAVSSQFIHVHHRSALRAQRGFSLIELLIVLAIMGVIAATASPAVGSLIERQRNKDTTSTIVSALKEARAESVLRGRNIEARIEAGKVNLTMEIVSSETKQKRAETVKSYAFFNKTSVPTGAITLIFQPNKRVNGSGVITTFCDEYGTKTGRKINIDVNGNISVDAGESQC